MTDGGVHCSCWIDTEEGLWCEGSNRGLEGIGKYLKKRKGEGIKTKNIYDETSSLRCDVKKLQWLQRIMYSWLLVILIKHMCS